MKKIQFSIGIILLVLTIFLLIICIKWNIGMNDYCSINCDNHNNENKICGNWYHINECDDDDAPNKTIFGSENTNIKNWCYELQGGRCGEFGLYWISFFVIFLMGIVSFMIVLFIIAYLLEIRAKKKLYNSTNMS